MSAALERERRSTAGKRMGNLVGKAQEDDEAFWGHDTWAEEGGEDNESFHESDEDSEARVDEFDSDFDESESDHDEEEAAAGMDEEMQLRREERAQKRKQKFDIAKAGRDLMRKKKGKGTRRIMGEGFNAGLVLNFPGNNVGPAPLPGTSASSAAALPVPPVAAPPATATITTRSISPRKSVRLSPIRRTLRTATRDKTRQAETRRKQQSSSLTAGSVSTATAAAPPAKKKQRQFTQEELLLEAATQTEPENVRWLLGRKRVEELANESQKMMQKDVQGKIVSKFHSRRGCPNTLTFSDMDHVPDVLARKAAPARPKADANVCVITGKPARYRDPKTMMGYHDVEAFRELRRRLEAGEPLDQRKSQKEPEEEKKASEDGKLAAVVVRQQQPQEEAAKPASTNSKMSASKAVPTMSSIASAGSSTGVAQKVAVAPPGSTGNVSWQRQPPASTTSAAAAPEAKRKAASSETPSPPARASKRRKKATPKAAIVAGSVPGVIASSMPAVQPAAKEGAVASRADVEPQSVSPETTTNTNGNSHTATHATLPA